jgi:REP element-mobilizing transposase RayT
MTETSLPCRHHPVHFPVLEQGNRSNLVFVTVCTKNRKRILASSEVLALLVKAWSAYDEWRVGRYVIMPDHVHFFCVPATPYPKSLRVWVRKWKAMVSRQWPRPEEQPIWQNDFWDRQLRHGESYAEKWKYVIANPVRQGLVTQHAAWPFQGQIGELIWHD